MQFQIPQFIETEDKIVGPFSLRQFLFIGGGIGGSLVLYFILNTWLWVFVTIILVGSTTALALVKVNGRSLPTLTFAALAFLWKPRIYVWQPEHPQMPKDESTLEEAVGSRFSLESIMAGLTLRHVSDRVKTGTVESKGREKRTLDRMKEKYQIFERVTGERRAARRVDYR